MKLRKILPMVILMGVAIGVTIWTTGQNEPAPPQTQHEWVIMTEPAEQAALTDVDTAQVLRVVDGDTLKVRIGASTERVRIIGIDTPEIGRNGKPDDCGAKAASTTLSELVDGRTIELRADPSQDGTDRYGRLLRHVTVDGSSVGQTILALGAGHEYTYDRAYAGQADYRQAETRAREQGRGIWGDCQR